MALIQLNINRWGQGWCMLFPGGAGRFITTAGIYQRQPGWRSMPSLWTNKRTLEGRTATASLSLRVYPAICPEDQLHSRQRHRGTERCGDGSKERQAARQSGPGKVTMWGLSHLK